MPGDAYIPLQVLRAYIGASPRTILFRPIWVSREQEVDSGNQVAVSGHDWQQSGAVFGGDRTGKQPRAEYGNLLIPAASAASATSRHAIALSVGSPSRSHDCGGERDTKMAGSWSFPALGRCRFCREWLWMLLNDRMGLWEIQRLLRLVNWPGS